MTIIAGRKRRLLFWTRRTRMVQARAAVGGTNEGTGKKFGEEMLLVPQLAFEQNIAIINGIFLESYASLKMGQSYVVGGFFVIIQRDIRIPTRRC